MQAYCMKCRTKREMKDAKAITMKNGKPANLFPKALEWLRQTNLTWEQKPTWPKQM